MMGADDDVVVSETIRIPRSELTLQFSRSGGPGGQNVNKVSSRVQLRWNVLSTPSLPAEVRERLEAHHRRRITATGELIITSSRYRDQPRNIEDCLEKLRELIVAAAATPRRRRPTKPSAGARRRRLQAKRERSERKQTRRPPGREAE
ncbi:MAG: aminoacyl-tRNA hydrolase [Planctomycetaceae bacterium]|nr:aminoacyl-tRNA hydrolase [Planctomycetaceae bacterium]